MLAVAPDSVTLQVPWDFDLGRPATLIGGDPASPFERVVSVPSAAAYPRFLGVVHQDYRGAPTASDPARPGEILLFYMTGLGPVSPAVRTGEPAPLWPLSRIQLPIRCSWGFGKAPAEVLFAGLAPGQIGLYLVLVRVPQPAGGSDAFSCTLGGWAPYVNVPAGAQ